MIRDALPPAVGAIMDGFTSERPREGRGQGFRDSRSVRLNDRVVLRSRIEAEYGLRRSLRDPSHARERQQLAQSGALLPPVVEDRLADQRVVPWQAAAQFLRQLVDALAPGCSRLALALDVRMAGLVLRLGFGQIDRIRRTHQEIREIKRRQTIVLDVTQTDEVVAVLADLAERRHPGVA